MSRLARIKGPAFTLIEILITIGVIALLIGILIPAIGKAKDRSRELASAVNLRSIGQLFEMYAGSSKGFYPAPVPGRIYPSFSPDIGVTIAHWQASSFWPGLFADTHPWWENESLYLAPGAERRLDGPVITLPRPSFEYSSSFLGDPSIWTDRLIADDEWPRLERSVRQSTVSFPASKSLMWDVEMPYLRRPPNRDAAGNLLENSPMLFADQHVTTKIQADSTPGVTNRAPFAGALHENLHNTPNGVRGRDY